jgi:hypothetical protein
VNHLRYLFNRGRKYGIYLNPKTSIFVVNEGEFLGFVVSKVGMMIEPERI